MSLQPEGTGTRPCWFVGAAFGGTDDQSSRFIQEGTWEISNPSEKETALVKSTQRDIPDLVAEILSRQVERNKRAAPAGGRDFW